VLFKRFQWQSPITVLVGWQLLIGFMVIAPAAIAIQPVPDFAAVHVRTWVALAYLIALPMIFCQWAYLKVVSLFPAAIAAIGTLLVPIVGVFSSALILGESVGWPEIIAMALIVAALVVVLVIPALAARRFNRASRNPGAPWPGRQDGQRTAPGPAPEPDRTRTPRSGAPAPRPYRLRS
jgi:drug/metabolite transporter (DMT)-like permease